MISRMLNVRSIVCYRRDDFMGYTDEKSLVSSLLGDLWRGEFRRSGGGGR